MLGPGGGSCSSHHVSVLERVFSRENTSDSMMCVPERLRSALRESACEETERGSFKRHTPYVLSKCVNSVNEAWGEGDETKHWSVCHKLGTALGSGRVKVSRNGDLMVLRVHS